jgi:hypothetical protein
MNFFFKLIPLFLGLVSLINSGIARANPSREVFIQLKDNTNPKPYSYHFVLGLGSEFTNPYQRQNTLRFVFEAAQQEVLFCQIETSLSQSSQSTLVSQTESGFDDENIKIVIRLPKNSIGYQCGLSPIQMLANFGFSNSAIPLDFRLSLGNGIQGFSNAKPMAYAAVKTEILTQITERLSLRLGYRATFLNFTSKDWESRGDIELGTGWEF